MLKLLFTAILFVFSPSNVECRGKFLGEFGNGSSVFGMANVYGLLHVVRENVPNVEVYTPPSDNFQRLRPLEVFNKSGFYDMAHLPKANMLILLNWFDGKNVIMMKMSPPYNITKWPFTQEDTVAAVSVTEGDEHIVITESVSKSLKVFTKEGVLIKQIFLMTIMSPRHAIRTVDNLYAVTFGYSRMEPHYICRFNVLGYVVGMCFGGKPGDSLVQLDVPSRMLNCPDGGLLVADMNNKRVLKVSRDLLSSEVVLSKEDGINHPYRLENYAAKKVLYVADNFLDPVTKYSVGGRVLAFKYKL